MFRSQGTGDRSQKPGDRDQETGCLFFWPLSPGPCYRGGAAGAAAGAAGVAAPAGGAGFFELWYIWVSRSSAMWPTSIVTLVIRLRKKALKKMAGTETAIPTRVTDRACEMFDARAAAFWPPVDRPSTM